MWRMGIWPEAARMQEETAFPTPLPPPAPHVAADRFAQGEPPVIVLIGGLDLWWPKMTR